MAVGVQVPFHNNSAYGRNHGHVPGWKIMEFCTCCLPRKACRQSKDAYKLENVISSPYCQKPSSCIVLHIRRQNESAKLAWNRKGPRDGCWWDVKNNIDSIKLVALARIAIPRTSRQPWLKSHGGCVVRCPRPQSSKATRQGKQQQRNVPHERWTMLLILDVCYRNNHTKLEIHLPIDN